MVGCPVGIWKSHAPASCLVYVLRKVWGDILSSCDCTETGSGPSSFLGAKHFPEAPQPTGYHSPLARSGSVTPHGVVMIGRTDLSP